MLLVDTNVVIKAFNDIQLLDLLAPLNPTGCTVVNIELLQGSKSKVEIKKVRGVYQG